MRMPSCAVGSRSHDGKRNYAIVQFLLQTGLQLDECSQLMLSDISLPSLFVVVSSLGLVMPNATALALSDHPRIAGSASALLGVLQYAVEATVAPLVGAFGTATAVPMAVVIGTLGCSALVVFVLLAGGNRSRARMTEANP